VKEVLDSVRLREEENDRGQQLPTIQGIVKIMERLDSAMADAVREDSIKSLVLSHKGRSLKHH
jgi:hypothetical protein